MSKPQAILFDLDNTLVDRTQSLQRYVKSLLADFQDALADVSFEQLHTVVVSKDQGGYGGWDAIFQAVLTHLPWRMKPQRQTLLSHRQVHYPATAVGMAELHETLQALQARSLNLGIVTNGAVHAQQGKIDQLQLAPYMRTIVISGALNIKKPDARIFQAALTKLDAPASKTWFVGDHPWNDILGATAVGLTPVWRRGFHTWSPEYDPPQRQINALQDLIPLIDADYG